MEAGCVLAIGFRVSMLGQAERTHALGDVGAATPWSATVVCAAGIRGSRIRVSR
jgi:hypothetical protein